MGRDGVAVLQKTEHYLSLDRNYFGNQRKSKGKNKERRFFCLRVKYTGLMVKCTPERGHNALFFIPLEVFIML